MTKTKIEWADETWNPVVGCSVASPGCKNCYAVNMAHRHASNPKMAHYAGTTARKNGGPRHWTGVVNVAPDHILLAPLNWKKPRRIFVNSMSDLFHENVSNETIASVFAVMHLCPQHVFMVLTKRSDRMHKWVSIMDQNPGLRDMLRYIHLKHLKTGDTIQPVQWPLPNVWLGVSVEDQRRAEERIPDLLATPAAVRWISAEPLLGPQGIRKWLGRALGTSTFVSRGEDFERCDITGIPIAGLDWVVVGGESGPRARPMHPEWARDLRDQCAAAGVPFFFKQWGEWLPWEPEHGPCWVAQNGASEDHHILFPVDFDNTDHWDDGLTYVAEGMSHVAFQRTGKKVSGKHLDGVEHLNWPRPHPSEVAP